MSFLLKLYMLMIKDYNDIVIINQNNAELPYILNIILFF